MRIGIDMGHTLSGPGTGAAGWRKETDCNREIGALVIKHLLAQGHTVVNCTVDQSSNDLYDRRINANAQTLDFFLSIHLNAGGGHGVETYIYNKSYPGKEENRAKAKSINDAVAASCGFRNRGVKEENFYVLRETVAPAALIEVCFLDSQEDKGKYNAAAIAAAIVKGLTGQSVSTPPPAPTPGPTPGGTKFRVVCGTFADRKNAEAQQTKLKEKGFDSFLVAIN